MIHTGKSETLGAAQSMRPDASTVLLLKAWRVLESHWSPIHIRRSKKLNSSNSSSDECMSSKPKLNSNLIVPLLHFSLNLMNAVSSRTSHFLNLFSVDFTSRNHYLLLDIVF